MTFDRHLLIHAMLKARERGCNDQPMMDFVYEEVMHNTDNGVRSMVFNREFAKAVWGTHPMEWRVGGYRMVDPDGQVVKVPACDFHLQQMALTDEPVAYLAKQQQLWDW